MCNGKSEDDKEHLEINYSMHSMYFPSTFPPLLYAWAENILCPLTQLHDLGLGSQRSLFTSSWTSYSHAKQQNTSIWVTTQAQWVIIFWPWMSARALWTLTTCALTKACHYSGKISEGCSTTRLFWNIQLSTSSLIFLSPFFWGWPSIFPCLRSRQHTMHHHTHSACKNQAVLQLDITSILGTKEPSPFHTKVAS